MPGNPERRSHSTWIAAGALGAGALGAGCLTLAAVTFNIYSTDAQIPETLEVKQQPKQTVMIRSNKRNSLYMDDPKVLEIIDQIRERCGIRPIHIPEHRDRGGTISALFYMTEIDNCAALIEVGSRRD